MYQETYKKAKILITEIKKGILANLILVKKLTTSLKVLLRVFIKLLTGKI
ncbi:MAG: hypothetical protein LBG45_09740 [Dysgonamonadaceae bacterium]|jgi:hypothetical protein|nr:hypothetical protein [Dysgonamonadaceae bacterium]